MIDDFIRYPLSKDQRYTISVVIPTWNNLEYLKNCLESIGQHSIYQHQVIVFVNEGSDGTPEWLKEHRFENLDYIISPVNVGICYGVNCCRSMVKSDYIVYMNDDMYVLPGWDKELLEEINRLDTRMFMLSSTLIEPLDTGNSCVVEKDFGTDLDSFRKSDLLNDFQNLKRSNWQGATWPPVLIHVDAWDSVGGFSTEFSPGMYSDPDLSFKLLQAGARDFIGVGSSLVYHFGAKSTKRVQRNQGRKMFLAKWGISSRVFRKKILRMGEDHTGPLTAFDPSIRNRMINRIKRMVYC